MTDTPIAVDDARLREIIAGCEGVTPGPWVRTEHKVAGMTLVTHEDIRVAGLHHHGERRLGNAHRDAAHIARLDPETIRAICTELLARRAMPAVSEAYERCASIADETLYCLPRYEHESDPDADTAWNYACQSIAESIRSLAHDTMLAAAPPSPGGQK